jgi:hypothetical protein
VLCPMILGLSDDGMIKGLDLSEERDSRDITPFQVADILNHIFDLEVLDDVSPPSTPCLYSEVTSQQPRSPSLKCSKKKLQLIAFIVKALAKEEDKDALLKMADHSWFSVAPSIIWKKTPDPEDDTSASSTPKDFEAICRKAIRPSQGSRIRHCITLYDTGVDPVSEASNFGCCNLLCPDRMKLFDLAEEGKGIDDELLPEGQEEVMYDKWGPGMKLCGG